MRATQVPRLPEATLCVCDADDVAAPGWLSGIGGGRDEEIWWRAGWTRTC